MEDKDPILQLKTFYISFYIVLYFYVTIKKNETITKCVSFLVRISSCITDYEEIVCCSNISINKLNFPTILPFCE